jgi:hypothetical protein
MTTQNVGQQILGLLENDLLLAAGPSIMTFLTNVEKNPAGEPGYWIQLTGALIAEAPQLELQVIQQIVGALQTKLAAKLASIPPTTVSSITTSPPAAVIAPAV